MKWFKKRKAFEKECYTWATRKAKRFYDKALDKIRGEHEAEKRNLEKLLREQWAKEWRQRESGYIEQVNRKDRYIRLYKKQMKKDREAFDRIMKYFPDCLTYSDRLVTYVKGKVNDVTHEYEKIHVIKDMFFRLNKKADKIADEASALFNWHKEEVVKMIDAGELPDNAEISLDEEEN